MDGCILWGGYVSPNGYGMGGGEYAHRSAYERVKGPIPNGLVIDHLCRNRACVNPDHLEAVTMRENLLRGDTVTARRAAQTHCTHGHEFTSENTYRKKNGCRSCRECHRLTEAARRRAP